MKLVIHRGSNQIGGSCVEFGFEGHNILLDIGLPLDYRFEGEIDEQLPESLSPLLANNKSNIDALILSHAHLDHYGLAGLLPSEIPVYCGDASAELMEITSRTGFGKLRPFQTKSFPSNEAFQIGPFSITPYLMDHSAFDAYGFLVSAGGKRVFYTGDFRGHGRKRRLLDRLTGNPPAKVDVLLMEGSMLGERAEEITLSESEVEDSFVREIEKTDGIVLVSTSSQNIDRLVSIFKAAKRTGRMLIIDFYTAEILERLGKYAKIPQPSWPRIRVCYPRMLADWFKRLGLEEVLERHRKNGIRWQRVNEISSKAIMLIRPGFLFELKRFMDLDSATWVYSMWRGYFERSRPLANLKSYLEGKGVRVEYIHTSGHAKLSDLKRLVSALEPKMVIPIHSFHPDKYAENFSNVRMMNDGEALELS